ncbi:MAG: hypothetical protein K2N11_08670, partial [Mucispirillum sp.]|nr:hypothetical protein [Mucispirillum sp.]
MEILHRLKEKRTNTVKENDNNPLFNAKNIYNARITELFSKYRFLQLLIIISMLITVTAISG